MKGNVRAYALFLAAALFWGLLYPQYALTENMYELTDGDEKPVPKDCRRDFSGLMSAEAQDVEIRFALLERVREWFGEEMEYGDRGK